MIEEMFKEYNPNLSDVSIRTYINSLKRINKSITGKDKIEDFEFIKDYDKVMKSLEKFQNHTQKNYLIPVHILFSVLISRNIDVDSDIYEKYTNKLKELRLKIDMKYDENTKSMKQDENWVKYSEVLKLLRKLKKDAKPFLEKDYDELNMSNLDTIQQYLVWYLYSGKAFEPVRNDFADMEIVKPSDTPTKPNYIILSKIPEIVITEHKTSNLRKKMGKPPEIRIKIKDTELRKLLKEWIRINPTNYLLISLKNGNEPMSPNGITKYLNKISSKHLGKTIGSSLLRSIYISEKHKGIKTINDKIKLADNMLHTAKTAMKIYNKKDDNSINE
tara:strand:+ start:1081 stop:2073 length:993 start_codon:yes stop_codon:yes gene_type:complete